MKICPSCNARFSLTVSLCPLCGQSLEILEGRGAFSPGPPGTGTGFRPRYFARLSELEASNFWFQSRNGLLIWALRRYFPEAESFLEIGCGTGFVIAGIETAFPRLAVFGAEIYPAGLAHASGRLKRAGLFHMDARELPFEETFDVIGAFDVLEHLEEDEAVLGRMYRAARPGGGIILTVPHHLWLWSRQDEVACHVRRYRARELKTRVLSAGFTLIRVTAFVSLLLPLMMLSRIRKTAPAVDFDPMSEMKLPPSINRFFKGILDVERWAISAGISFPAGGSLLVVAKKPHSQKGLSL